MTQLIVLPHLENCPDGAVIEAEEGKSICETLLENGIELDHACEMSCACTTCHVIVREGFNSLTAAEEEEEDLLDKAWGLEPNSRLGCQAIVRSTPLTVEIPQMKWTDINDIAIELSEAHPDKDPLKINFVDLRDAVMALPGFDDVPERCGEKILEAIQQAWIDEVE